MPRKPRAPKPIPLTTLRAVAACHAVGLSYYGGTGSLLVAVDGQDYHVVRVRTSGGVTGARHACCPERTALAGVVATTYRASREATRAELALVAPSWLCDTESDFVDVPPTDGIMAAAGFDLTVEVD